MMNLGRFGVHPANLAPCPSIGFTQFNSEQFIE